MTMAWPPYNLAAVSGSGNSIDLTWHDNMAYLSVYLSANDWICFKENVNEVVAQVPPDLSYTAETLAAAIATAMTAASESGWTYYADFNSASNLWTISCNHVFSILWNTGTYINNDLSDLLGYANDHDDTGSSSYAGKNAAQYTNSHYNIVYIERSLTTGSGFVQIDSKLWGDEGYTDNSVVDGTHYYYRIRGYSGLYTDYSNEADTWVALPAPTGLYGTCIDKNTVKIKYVDNSISESGFKISQNGNESYASVGVNVQEYTDTGLTPGQWYFYKVRAYNASVNSDWTAEIGVFTTDPPNAPTNLTGQATSTTTVRFNFQDNSSNETAFAIMEYAPGGPWTEVDTVGPNVTTYERTGLTANTAYSYLVKARGAGGDSGYSNQVNITTMADIAKPTNVVATAISDTVIEVTFQDNSNAEDHHAIERKPDGGAYAEIVELAPNQTYYKDTGRTKGVKYWYKIRAKEDTGPAYSDYSDEAYATTISEPSAPTALAISEIQDTWMILTWTKTTGETGYKIYKSTNGADYALFNTIGAAIERYKVTGLAASTPYWFKILAYNAAGNSDYTAAVTDTTLAAYTETAFETLCRNPLAKFKFLIELNPLMEMAGFALTGGQTYTYELEVQERGIDIETVTENDTAYTEKTSIATVEATASTFWFDYYGRKLYVHTSAGDDPVNYQILGTFYLRFTNYSTSEVPTVFNENMYLSFVPQGGIPDTGGEIKPYYEGNYAVSSGVVRIINPELPTGSYWDQKFSKYEFRNRNCVIKLGGETFTYTQFKEIHTGVIHRVDMTDREVQFTLRDKRANLARTLPINLYDSTAYPNIDTNVGEARIPFFFGTQANIVPVCVDTTNKKYKFHDGRCKAVNSCLQNGTTALVEDTDFYVDYQNSIIQLAAGVTLNSGEYLVLNIDGQPDLANNLISNEADIFRYICNNFLDLTDAELNLDSIYDTKLGFTTAIAVPIYQTESSDDVFRKLERTGRCYTFQDELGRIGLKMAITSAGSNVRYVRNHQIYNHKQYKSLDDAYYEMTIYYNVNPQTHYHQWKKMKVETIRRKTKSLQSLPVYTYLPTEATTQTLLNNVINELDKSFVKSDIGPIILGVLPGDIIKYSRDRFYNLDGTANEKNLRILRIDKSFAGTTAKVSILAEAV